MNMKIFSREYLVSFLNEPCVQSILYSRFLDFHQFCLLSFVKKHAKAVGRDQSILDAGAGELKYKAYFSHCKYVSQDLCIGDAVWCFENIDIKSSVYEIPVKDKSFDFILCTQVLEHLEFPEKAFEEFSRILKEGGKLLLTVPLGSGEHQIPHDYFRFTRYALAGLGKRHRLELTSIEPHGGVFMNLRYVMDAAISTLIPFKGNAVVRYVWFILYLPFGFILNIAFYLLDFLDSNKVYTLNYNCVYHKTSSV